MPVDHFETYTYNMHYMQRTSLLLDDETRRAARQLSLRYGCSVSEAIRRAVVRHRDAVLGVPAERRKARMEKLGELFELFKGHDAEEEVRRLKTHDEGF